MEETLQGVLLEDLLNGNITNQDGTANPYAKKMYDAYRNNPESCAKTIIRAVLNGLMRIHDNGIVHRDISTSNIIITPEGDVKLVANIVKNIIKSATKDTNLTTDGIFMGNPLYAAPELVLGEIKNQKSETDIYAIGILMYQLITGHLPFDGPTNQILHQHIHAKMPLKNVKDRRLRKIIKRATEKSTSKRYHSCSEMMAALDGTDIIIDPLPFRTILKLLLIFILIIVVLWIFIIT